MNSNDRASKSSGSMAVPRGLEGRVEFWRLIFTKYGKHHRVFHNRAHPEIIYSVIDFSEFEQVLSGKVLLKAKEAEIEKEKEKIKDALLSLASGRKPRNEFEKRIDTLYSRIKGNKAQNMRDGATDELIRYQTGIKERFRDGLVRSGRYLKAIEHIFVEEGLPPELGRLPLVESSFDYTAYSSVGAAGIWQFMPATAKRYMTLNNNLDERRDPIIATRAAAKYLRNSYQNTGEWPLAVTSYNHGLSGVMRAVKEVGSINLVDIIEKYKGKSFGFASGNFYAEFLAALEVERNSEKYFPGLVRESAVEFEEVKIPKSLRYAELKSYTGADDDRLQELNRSFKPVIIKGSVPIPSGTLIKVPAGAGTKLSSKLPGSKILARSSDFRSYLYQSDKNKNQAVYASLDTRGDRVVEVVKVPKIIPELSTLKPGEIPSAPEDRKIVTPGMEIQLGEEIGPARTITAKSAPLPSAKNNTSSKISPSKVPVKSPSNSKVVTVKKNAKTYRVKSGDTLLGISKKHNVSIKELKKLNGLKAPKDLKAGKEIKIPS
ncbi:MAG TPA: transglycosylase SLT domain-containing protein [Oligoflexia bacterium]|nr:transglycosylase SLT domain-containing protein [Oligoflexia bacterium]HMP48085.1 transglycosylase SLT domain-containing protein [Oligoflexia bacterium]